MAKYFARTTAMWLAAIAIPMWAVQAQAYDPQPDFDALHYEWARVLDAQPVYERVQIPETRRVCRNEAVTRRVPEYRSPAPVIVGALLGGVIGSELSRGHGHRYHGGYRHGYRRGHGHGGNRAAGTLAGVAIGSIIGSSVQYSAAPPRYYDDVVKVCGTETRYRDEDRIVGWDVTWDFHGQVYHSRMDEEPGERIRVSVRPIGR
ncbi:MAG: hypothetical protein PVF89_04440 [Lysobacterales bacterium]|jgi:uncharacterized protein YcfJ